MTFHDRGVDADRTATLRGAFLYGVVDAPGRDRWNCEPGERIMDDADCTQSHRWRRRVLQRQALSHSYPLYTLEFLSMLADVGIKSVKLPAITKFECIRGEIREDD